ncbi:MAG TPA: thioredoxin family protein [Methanoregulaceae archaeon]|nr:thioredoxin family protein [Methanoregulaceae archaeon]
MKPLLRLPLLIIIMLALSVAGCLSAEGTAPGGPGADLPSPSPSPGVSPEAGVTVETPATTGPGLPTVPSMAETADVLFFWGTGCENCEEARPFVEAMARTHPSLRFESIDIYASEENAARYYEVNRALNVTPRGVPEVIVAGSALFGDEEIRKGLPAALRTIEKGGSGRSG